MPKFHGRVGYGSQTETRPGVWEDVITERTYFGDVTRNSRALRGDGGPDHLNADPSVNNMISIVVDAYARDNFMNIRFVEWVGVLWTVTTVDVQHPRLILYLGEVYNGPRAT